jgi:hypothetical protein
MSILLIATGFCRSLLCRPGCNRLHTRGSGSGGWPLSLNHTVCFVCDCKGACICRSFPPSTRVACLLVVEAACILVLGRKTVRPTHELGVRAYRRAADLWSHAPNATRRHGPRHANRAPVAYARGPGPPTLLWAVGAPLSWGPTRSNGHSGRST